MEKPPKLNEFLWRESTSSAEASTEDLTLGSTDAHTENFTEDFTQELTGEDAENSTEDLGEEGETLSEEELILVIAERIDEDKVKITQPEAGKSMTFYEVDGEQLSLLGFAEGEYGTREIALRNNRIEPILNPETGKTTLMVYKTLAGADHNLLLIWEIGLEDGVWTVTDFYAPG